MAGRADGSLVHWVIPQFRGHRTLTDVIVGDLRLVADQTMEFGAGWLAGNAHNSPAIGCALRAGLRPGSFSHIHPPHTPRQRHERGSLPLRLSTESVLTATCHTEPVSSRPQAWQTGMLVTLMLRASSRNVCTSKPYKHYNHMCGTRSCAAT